jgi:hypothetical protein
MQGVQAPSEAAPTVPIEGAGRVEACNAAGLVATKPQDTAGPVQNGRMQASIVLRKKLTAGTAGVPSMLT